MKKLLKSLAICGALFMMASCSSKSEKSQTPAEQAVSVLEKATTDIQKVSSEKEAKNIYEATMTKVQGIIEKAGDDYEPSDADEAKLEKAAVAFVSAAAEKMGFGGNIDIDYEDYEDDYEDYEDDDFDF